MRHIFGNFIHKGNDDYEQTTLKHEKTVVAKKKWMRAAVTFTIIIIFWFMEEKSSDNVKPQISTNGIHFVAYIVNKENCRNKYEY